MPSGPERDRSLEAVFHELTGLALPSGSTIQERMFKGLLEVDFAYHMDRNALTPKPLDELVQQVWGAAGRGAPGEGAIYFA